MDDLTVREIEVIIPLIDLGIKSAGLRVFENEGGLHLHSALKKLQRLAAKASHPTAAASEPE